MKKNDVDNVTDRGVSRGSYYILPDISSRFITKNVNLKSISCY